MADYDDNDDDTGTETDDQSQDTSVIRDLRKRAKTADQATQRAAKAEREIAFLKAGIDLDTPHGKLLAAGYDGEITVDAIKAAAVELGIATAPTLELPQQQAEALNRLNDTSAGAGQATEADQYLDRLNKIPAVVSDGAGGWTLNPNGPTELMAVLQEAGLGVSNDTPGSWLFDPNTGHVPRSIGG